MPAATDGEAGVTEMEFRVGAVTVNFVVPLMLPDLAVMVEVPAAMPVASPAVLTAATEVEDELHVALLVRFCVVPLL